MRRPNSLAEVVSLAILGDGSLRWPPDNFGYSRWGCRVGIRFPVVKLLDYSPQWEALEKNPNPLAVLVLAHLKTLETRQDPGERHASKIRLIKGLYDRGLSADGVRQLFRLIDWIMELPNRLEATFWEQVKQYEEELEMPYMTTPERIAREEGLSEGLSQGRSQGLSEGLSQGLSEGLSQGLSQGLTKGIEVALKVKFGEEGLRLLPEVREIEDQERLEAILVAIPTATGPDELRQIWTD